MLLWKYGLYISLAFYSIGYPGIIKQGLRWMMSSSSRFYIKPRLNLDLVRWGMRFWKKANASQVEQSAPHLNNLLQLSRELMSELKSDLPASFDMIEKGCWMLYKTHKTEEHEKHLAEKAEHFGLKTIMCNANQVQEYETEVELDIMGGVLYLDDCHIDSSKFMRVLYSHLQKMGTKFWINTEVTGFEKNGTHIKTVITDKGELTCDELIIANGSWMGNLSKELGLRLPMQPGKGYSIVYNNLPKNLKFPSILVDDRTATTPIDRWLRIGGTMELSGHSDNILPKRVMALYNNFKKYYPSMNLEPPDISKAWYGYRPVSPDGMPYIGRHSAFNNLSFAGGHAMLGVSAAAGTGRLLEEIIGNRRPSISMDAFDPARFK